jgi:hypothetical protein
VEAVGWVVVDVLVDVAEDVVDVDKVSNVVVDVDSVGVDAVVNIVNIDNIGVDVVVAEPGIAVIGISNQGVNVPCHSLVLRPLSVPLTKTSSRPEPHDAAVGPEVNTPPQDSHVEYRTS